MGCGCRTGAVGCRRWLVALASHKRGRRYCGHHIDEHGDHGKHSKFSSTDNTPFCGHDAASNTGCIGFVGGMHALRADGVTDELPREPGAAAVSLSGAEFFLLVDRRRDVAGGWGVGAGIEIGVGVVVVGVVVLVGVVVVGDLVSAGVACVGVAGRGEEVLA